MNQNGVDSESSRVRVVKTWHEVGLFKIESKPISRTDKKVIGLYYWVSAFDDGLFLVVSNTWLFYNVKVFAFEQDVTCELKCMVYLVCHLVSKWFSIFFLLGQILTVKPITKLITIKNR